MLINSKKQNYKNSIKTAVVFSLFILSLSKTGYADQQPQRIKQQPPLQLEQSKPAVQPQTQVVQPQKIEPQELPLQQPKLQIVNNMPQAQTQVVQPQPQKVQPAVQLAQSQPVVITQQAQAPTTSSAPGPQVQVKVIQPQPQEVQLPIQVVQSQPVVTIEQPQLSAAKLASVPQAQTQVVQQQPQGVQSQPQSQASQSQAQSQTPASPSLPQSQAQSQVQVVQVQIQPQPQVVSACNAATPVASNSCCLPCCKPKTEVKKPRPKVIKKVAKPVEVVKIFKIVEIVSEPAQKTCLDKYHPYLAVGVMGKEYSKIKSQRMAMTYDLFLPVFSPNNNELVFTDLRFFDPSGSSFEGNIQLGYRHLMPKGAFGNNEQIFGVYASFDRIRSEDKNYFNQIGLGGEYWLNRWFVGGNVYLPIGTKEKLFEETATYKDYEIAAKGVSGEVGYALTKNLAGYVDGFYFDANEAGKTKGVGAKLEYLIYPDLETRLLGLFDNARLRVGMRKYFSKGLEGFVELRLRLGLSACPNPSLSLFESHMVDTIRREPHIVTKTYREDLPKVTSPIVVPVSPSVPPPGDGGGAAPADSSEPVSDDTFKSPPLNTAKTRSANEQPSAAHSRVTVVLKGGTPEAPINISEASIKVTQQPQQQSGRGNG